MTKHTDRVEGQAQGAPRTLPDRIADELIAQIFIGELPAGQALPPERALAEQLGVDRTSLRAALRQLTRMGLVRAVRGSGVTVLDYRAHAGLDFLAAVLGVPGLELGGTFLLEALAHWNAVMPRVTALAFARATPDSLAQLDALLERQLGALDAGAGTGAIAELEVALQDLIVHQTGDLTLRLMANSTRPLRLRITELQYGLVDARAQVQRQRGQLATVRRGDPVTPAQVRAHSDALQAQHAALRAHLLSLPQHPHRTSHWDKPVRAKRNRPQTLTEGPRDAIG